MSPSLQLWKNSHVRENRTWEFSLSDDQRNELVRVTRAAITDGATIDTITIDQFPLRGLTDVIDKINHDLSQGLGFVLLQKFPVDLLSNDEIELAYYGLGLHLGTPVRQNSNYELLSHIRDDRIEQNGQIKRLYRTRERQDFHTDAADIIGLLCLHKAKSGGESKIVSSPTLYAEMMSRRPDLVDELRVPLVWDKQDEHKEGETPWFALPPIFDLNGEARIFYVGWYIRNAQRWPEVPRLTEKQLEAMELLESIANDPEFYLEMDFEPGDIQFLNNGRILHAREAYDDWEDPDKRRHLLRLWLAAHKFVSLEEKLRTGVNAQ
jgi:hypothetical protein